MPSVTPPPGHWAFLGCTYMCIYSTYTSCPSYGITPPHCTTTTHFRFLDMPLSALVAQCCLRLPQSQVAHPRGTSHQVHTPYIYMQETSSPALWHVMCVCAATPSCDVTGGGAPASLLEDTPSSAMQKHSRVSLQRCKSTLWIPSWCQIPNQRRQQGAWSNGHSRKLQLWVDLHGMRDSGSCDNTAIWLVPLPCSHNTLPYSLAQWTLHTYMEEQASRSKLLLLTLHKLDDGTQMTGHEEHICEQAPGTECCPIISYTNMDRTNTNDRVWRTKCSHAVID